MKTSATLPSAWTERSRIARRLGAHGGVLFLDYDGTLTPIVRDFAEARLDEGMRAILARLAARFPVAIVSGRDVGVLRAFVGLDSLYYVGSHGFDMTGPAGWREVADEAERFLPAIDAAERDLRRDLAGIEGHAVERKAFHVAVHYRGVPVGRVDRIESIVDAALKRHPGLRKGYGKKVFEVQPDYDWHKGRAVSRLLERLRPGGSDAVAIYIGDDITDEDAFRALRGKGVSIVVRDGDRPTAADYALDDTEDVRRFLEFLAESKSATPGKGRTA